MSQNEAQNSTFPVFSIWDDLENIAVTICSLYEHCSELFFLFKTILYSFWVFTSVLVSCSHSLSKPHDMQSKWRTNIEMFTVHLSLTQPCLVAYIHHWLVCVCVFYLFSNPDIMTHMHSVNTIWLHSIRAQFSACCRRLKRRKFCKTKPTVFSLQNEKTYRWLPQSVQE